MLTPKAGPTRKEVELFDAIRAAQQAVVGELVPHVMEHGLGSHTFWPLWYLARGAEPHPGELARRIGVSPPACTQAVDQLVAAGYVERLASPGDRRQVVLQVTPKGREVLDQIWGEVDRSIAGVLSDLTAADVSVTARTLRAFAERLGTSHAGERLA